MLGGCNLCDGVAGWFGVSVLVCCWVFIWCHCEGACYLSHFCCHFVGGFLHVANGAVLKCPLFGVVVIVCCQCGVLVQVIDVVCWCRLLVQVVSLGCWFFH